MDVRQPGEMTLAEMHQLIGEQAVALRAERLRSASLAMKLAEMESASSKLAEIGVDVETPVTAQ